MSGFSPGRTVFKLAFELCPIFLTNGIAGNLPFSVLPIIALTEAINLPLALLSGGGENVELDDFFAHYIPMAGGSLIDNQISEYPFANQAVAANALIQQPLMISLRMICPARTRFGYASKLATMLLLQSALAEHNRTGGTYTVLTPSHFYTNCIMLAMRDITGGGGVQVQQEWQMDFRQPLLTTEDANAAQGNLMRRFSSGTQIEGDPAWSGTGTNIGQVSPSTPADGISSTVPRAVDPPPLATSPGSGTAFANVQPINTGFPV